jgi:hypothetical protein
MAQGDIDEDVEASSGDGGANPMPTTGAATIDAPALTPSGDGLELEAKSIKTTAQAWQICTTLEQNNRQRALRTADIQAIHDGEPPKSAAAQAEKAKSWQSNASTGWLGGIVGRQAQRFVNAIISQLYLTYSQLPATIDDYKPKSDLMQAKVTRLIRSWCGYTGTINSLAVETVLQGYTYAVFLDPHTSKPKMFKQDRLFLPELAQEHASELQFFCAKEDYRLDKFLALFSDETAAEDTGYDLENCFAAANKATMQDPREDATTTQFRKFTDMINEGTLGLSYSSTGERVVKVWLLFNREYDGKVSFWMIDRDNGTKLRFSFKLFKKMEDVIVMFSFEPGNGCIHSSKGLGRKLAALAIIKELFRNGLIDAARISMLMLLQTDSKDRNKIAPQIMSPFIYIDKSITVSETQFNADTSKAEGLDQLIDNWAEQSVGAYLASQAEEKQPEKTATQATIEAKREQEAADIQIRRWLDQIFGLTQVQQLRAFSDDNIDKAQDLYEKILKDPDADEPELYEGHECDPEILRTLVEILRDPRKISVDEVKIWRSTPATVFAHVSDAVIQQGIESVYTTFKGDPNVDQSKIVAKVIEGRVGAQDAEELVIPTPDQTVIIEASRMQLEEAGTMASNLFKIGVSPRDNHLVHAATCQQLLTKLAPTLSSNPNPPPQFMQNVELLYNHMGDHLNFAVQTPAAQSQDFLNVEKFYKEFGKQLQQVVAIQQQAKVAAAAVTHKIITDGPSGGAGQPAPGAQPASAAPGPDGGAQPAPALAAAA